MPFGLKNAGETYQITMTTIFHDMMHTFMEDYVDDFLAKSYTREGNLEILSNLFIRMKKFNVWLNPKKCVFGVKFGKLLGDIGLEKGIEVDLGKVQAIMNIPPHEISISSDHCKDGYNPSRYLLQKWQTKAFLLHIYCIKMLNSNGRKSVKQHLIRSRYL
jgi:hypothetical protein